MGFGQAIAAGWSNWLNFQGRARRSEYWFWQLFVALGLLAITMMGAIAFQIVPDRVVSQIAIGVGVLFFLAVWLPGISLSVRRMHDIGFTGWAIFINFIPYIGALIFFVLTLLPGTRGTNGYGPDSREAAGAADVFT